MEVKVPEIHEMFKGNPKIPSALSRIFSSSAEEPGIGAPESRPFLVLELDQLLGRVPVQRRPHRFNDQPTHLGVSSKKGDRKWISAAFRFKGVSSNKTD